MKKNRFSEFFKGKGYFVLLFVGVLAIATVALLGSRISTDRNGEGNRVDLNEPNNNIAAGENNNQIANNDSASGQIVNNGQTDNSNDAITNDVAKQNPISNDNLLEFDVFTKEEESGIDLAEASSNSVVAEEQEEQTASVETTGKTVKAEPAPVKLSFNDEDGLSWPVNGNVIMNYSMDHTIYHATLMLYKCNPAIIIDAEVGTEVLAAAKGVVSSIENNEETGLTVTMNIGDGYSLVYGQLKDVKLKVGDKIEEGKVVGFIKEPTRYFIVEGSNLYFKVLKDGETVNPMLYLR